MNFKATQWLVDPWVLMKAAPELYGKATAVMDRQAYIMFGVISQTFDDQAEMMRAARDKWKMQTPGADTEGMRKAKDEAIDLGKRIGFMRCARKQWASEFIIVCVACFPSIIN